MVLALQYRDDACSCVKKAAARGPAVADRSIPLVVRHRMSRCSDTVPPKQPINSNPKHIAGHILQEYHF
jgi:hypothetical protein